MTYTELIRIATLRERFEALKIGAKVGQSTFGWERYLNQKFYTSEEWKRFRRSIILRDECCEMGLRGYPIAGPPRIHHIVPLESSDFLNLTDRLLDPENAVCVSLDMHNAIHFGDFGLVDKSVVERKPGDTCPWKKF